MTPTIAVDCLTFRYHLAEVLHGISFHINESEIVGLLGPNGASKNATLKILTGTLSPGTGTVRIRDFSLPDQRIEAKRIMGYVPETAGLYESLSAQECLEFIGRVRGIGFEGDGRLLYKAAVLLG